MKTLFSSLLLLGLLSFQSMSLKAQNKPKNDFLKECTEFAVAQTEKMLQLIGEPNGRNYPRTMNEQGKLVTTGMYDWTPGFFPGSLWYLYELTGDPKWKTEARKWTVSLERLKTFTGHHDLGFMMYCSYGNAERLASEPSYKDILVEVPVRWHPVSANGHAPLNRGTTGRLGMEPPNGFIPSS